MMSASLIAGSALTAGGMVANSIASNKAAAARQSALQYNDALQAGYNSRISADHGAELAPYTNFAEANAAKGSELAALFNHGNIGTGTGPASTLPVASSALVANEDAKRAGQAATFAGQQGTALGTLKATGQALADANVERSHADHSAPSGIVNAGQ